MKQTTAVYGGRLGRSDSECGRIGQEYLSLLKTEIRLLSP